MAFERITVDPAVCGGRPCIRNLRIRVKDVLDLLAAGERQRLEQELSRALARREAMAAANS